MDLSLVELGGDLANLEKFTKAAFPVYGQMSHIQGTYTSEVCFCALVSFSLFSPKGKNGFVFDGVWLLKLMIFQLMINLHTLGTYYIN